MKVKITRITLSLLRNSEFVLFINQIVDVLKIINLSLLLLADDFEKLSETLISLAKVKAQENAELMTKELKRLDMKRSALFRSILQEIHALSSSDDHAIIVALGVINHFLDVQGRDIARLDVSTKTQKIFDLFTAFIADAEVQAAVIILHLDVLFTPLRENNAAYNTLFIQRSQKKADIEKVDIKAIRRETVQVYQSFVKSVEYCSEHSKSLDYAPLANNMNDLIGYYKAHLKARATRRKNGKDVKTETDISPKTILDENQQSGD